MAERRPVLGYVLNTRPILNFLGIDRFDVIQTALDTPVWVSPTVLEEVRACAAAAERDLRRRTRDPHRYGFVEPWEISLVENWSRYRHRLVAPHVRTLLEITYDEQATVARYLTRLDEGESEMLAVAKHRGLTAVIDELAGHCLSVAEGIPHESTLSILVRGVRTGRIDQEEGERIWVAIQGAWPRAPEFRLARYLSDRPIWRPCPQGF